MAAALNEVHIVQHLHGHRLDDQKDEESAPSLESGPSRDPESNRESESPETLQSLGIDHISEFHDHWLSGRAQLHQLYTYYAHGTMEDLIRQNGALSEKQILQILRQICVGLEYVHSKGIIHLDLKPSNIFITEQYQLKIGDFGISVNVNPDESVLGPDLLRSPLASSPNEKEKRKYHCSGDPIYIAPELLTFGSSIKNIDFKTDIFSLGIMLLEMLLDCKLPSQGAVFQDLRNGIIDFDALVRTVHLTRCTMWCSLYTLCFLFKRFVFH